MSNELTRTTPVVPSTPVMGKGTCMSGKGPSQAVVPVVGNPASSSSAKTVLTKKNRCLTSPASLAATAENSAVNKPKGNPLLILPRMIMPSSFQPSEGATVGSLHGANLTGSENTTIVERVPSATASVATAPVNCLWVS